MFWVLPNLWVALYPDIHLGKWKFTLQSNSVAKTPLKTQRKRTWYLLSLQLKEVRYESSFCFAIFFLPQKDYYLCYKILSCLVQEEFSYDDLWNTNFCWSKATDGHPAGFVQSWKILETLIGKSMEFFYVMSNHGQLLFSEEVMEMFYSLVQLSYKKFQSFWLSLCGYEPRFFAIIGGGMMMIVHKAKRIQCDNWSVYSK